MLERLKIIAELFIFKFANIIDAFRITKKRLGQIPGTPTGFIRFSSRGKLLNVALVYHFLLLIIAKHSYFSEKIFIGFGINPDNFA